MDNLKSKNVSKDIGTENIELSAKEKKRATALANLAKANLARKERAKQRAEQPDLQDAPLVVVSEAWSDRTAGFVLQAMEKVDNLLSGKGKLSGNDMKDALSLWREVNRTLSFLPDQDDSATVRNSGEASGEIGSLSGSLAAAIKRLPPAGQRLVADQLAGSMSKLPSSSLSRTCCHCGKDPDNADD